MMGSSSILKSSYTRRNSRFFCGWGLGCSRIFGVLYTDGVCICYHINSIRKSVLVVNYCVYVIIFKFIINWMKIENLCDLNIYLKTFAIHRSLLSACTKYMTGGVDDEGGALNSLTRRQEK